MLQCLGFHTFTAEGMVQSLVGELRSHEQKKVSESEVKFLPQASVNAFYTRVPQEDGVQTPISSKAALLVLLSAQRPASMPSPAPLHRKGVLPFS